MAYINVASIHPSRVHIIHAANDQMEATPRMLCRQDAYDVHLGRASRVLDLWEAWGAREDVRQQLWNDLSQLPALYGDALTVHIVDAMVEGAMRNTPPDAPGFEHPLETTGDTADVRIAYDTTYTTTGE